MYMLKLSSAICTSFPSFLFVIYGMLSYST